MSRRDFNAQLQQINSTSGCKEYRAWRKTQRALMLLREARNLLRAADHPRTLARVRLAITSAGGAERHAYGRYVRAWRPSR